MMSILRISTYLGINGYYIKKDIINVNKNEKCWNNIRLNFYERNDFFGEQ